MASVFAACCSSMVSVFLVTGSGMLLGKLKIYTAETNLVLVKASFKTLLPIFCFLMISLTISQSSNLDNLWKLQLGTLLCISLGLMLGFGLVHLFDAPETVMHTYVTLVSFPNLGNVPVLIAEGVCADYGPLANYVECPKMEGFILLSNITFNIMAWGIGYSIVLKDAQAKAKAKVVNYFSAINDDKASLMSESFEEPPPPGEFDFTTVLKHSILSPIPLASLIGILFGLLPGVTFLLFEHQAPLRFLVNSLIGITYLSIVFSQQVLGFNIQEQLSNYHQIDAKILVGIITCRLMIIPLIMQLLCYLLISSEIISVGIGFVIMIGSAAPPGVTTMAINQLLNVGLEQTSVVFLFSYPISVVTMTLHCFLFFGINTIS